MAHTQQHASSSKAGDFFAKSPLFSFVFAANTSVLILCLIMVLFITFRYWGFVSHWSLSWMLPMAWFFMLTSWRLAWKNRGRISELFEAGVIARIEPGSPLEASLEAASDALTRVLNFSFVANGFLLCVIVYLLRHS